MNWKKAAAIIAVVAGASLPLVACDSSWQVPNLATADVTGFTCQQTVQALNTLDIATQEKDRDSLAAIGVNDQNQSNVRTKLNARNNVACNGATPSASATPAGQGGNTPAIDANGNRVSVPFVAGETVSNGDTRESTSMPSLSKLLPDCGVLIDWQSLVDCVEKHKAQWFIDGVNNRSADLNGATWDDIKKWATAKLPDGSKPEVRVIQTYKMNLSEDAARKAVSPLIGEATARQLPVVPYDTDAFANTWRTAGETPNMTTFADYNAEVRVTLAPLVLNDDGTVKGLLQGVPWGVFVDCYNVHFFWRVVAKTPTSPLLCPPGTSKAGQPMSPGLPSCTPPGQTPPPPPPPPGCKGCIPPPPECKTCVLEKKDPHQIPGNGGVGDGGSGKYGGTGGQKMTAEPTAAPPKAGPPPATYNPPPPVRTTAPPAGSTPTTAQPPPPESGANPTGGGGNTGLPPKP